MEIDKARMKDEYIAGNYDSFFKDAAEVTGYLLNKKYVLEPEEKADLLQDCMVSLWEKHLDNKIDVEKGDIMAFVWKNSTYKILDYLKKKKEDLMDEDIELSKKYQILSKNTSLYAEMENTSINDNILIKKIEN